METTSLRRYMNVGFGSRLLAFFALWVLLAVVAMVVCYFLTRSGVTTPRLRVATVVQDVLMFVVPPVVSAVIACRLPARLLLLNPPGRLLPYLAAIGVAFVSIPAMNCLVSLNESLRLPEFLAQMEDAGSSSISVLMGEATVASLIVNLLIVALLAGFSEELFFRGGLQRLLQTRPMNGHAAVWITAAVFSAVHMQFNGFVPRMLLGAWFGYLAWWSGTLWLPVTAHVANNAIVVIAHWCMERGYIAVDLDKVGTHGTGSLPSVVGSVVLTALLVILIYRLLGTRKSPEILESNTDA